MSFSTVRPINPPAAYLGGKKNLAQRLSEYFEEIPHKTYAEPFMGMGGVFFRRTSAPNCEIINDISHDIFNLFRITQKHYRELLYVLRYQMSSRRAFELFLMQNPESLTDIERAARFFYLQKTCFGGKVSGVNYGVDKLRSRFNIRQIKKHLTQIHQRLEGVVVECLHYSEFIDRYDSADTLFYLDPPYWNCENDYGKGVFSRADFYKLSEQLSGISGQFIMSLNDTPGVREVFSRFQIESVKTRYSIGENNQQVTEVLIYRLAGDRTLPVVQRQPQLFGQ